MIDRDIDPIRESGPHGEQTTYMHAYSCRDAALMCVNTAIAQLAELAADLHAHDDEDDDICGRDWQPDLSPEYECLLDRLEYIGHGLIAMSDHDEQLQYADAQSNYVRDQLQADRMTHAECADTNANCRVLELNRWESWLDSLD